MWSSPVYLAYRLNRFELYVADSVNVVPSELDEYYTMIK